MRTIGRFNRLLVKVETERAMIEQGNFDVEELVICRLPEKLWEIYEGADTEIRRVIWDTARGK